MQPPDAITSVDLATGTLYPFGLVVGELTIYRPFSPAMILRSLIAAKKAAL